MLERITEMLNEKIENFERFELETLKFYFIQNFPTARGTFQLNFS